MSCNQASQPLPVIQNASNHQPLSDNGGTTQAIDSLMKSVSFCETESLNNCNGSSVEEPTGNIVSVNKRYHSRRPSLESPEPWKMPPEATKANALSSPLDKVPSLSQLNSRGEIQLQDHVISGYCQNASLSPTSPGCVQDGSDILTYPISVIPSQEDALQAARTLLHYIQARSYTEDFSHEEGMAIADVIRKLQLDQHHAP